MDDENILINPHYHALQSSIPVGGCRNCKSRRRLFYRFLVVLMLLSLIGIILVSHAEAMKYLEIILYFQFCLYLLRGQIEEVRQMDLIIIKALVEHYHNPNFNIETTTPVNDEYTTTSGGYWTRPRYNDYSSY